MYIHPNQTKQRSMFYCKLLNAHKCFFSSLTVFQPFTVVKYIEAIRGNLSLHSSKYHVGTGRSLLGIVHVIGRYMWQFFGGFCVDGLYVYFLLVGTGVQIKIYVLY